MGRLSVTPLGAFLALSRGIAVMVAVNGGCAPERGAIIVLTSTGLDLPNKKDRLDVKFTNLDIVSSYNSLSVINSFDSLGPNYFAHMSSSQSRLSYVLAPSSRYSAGCFF